MCQMLLEDGRIRGPKTDHWIWQHGGHGDLDNISSGCNTLMGVDLGKNGRRGTGDRSQRHPFEELCCKAKLRKGRGWR